MKVGILARSLDDRGGPGVANRNLVDAIIDRDRGSNYVVFFQSPLHFGRYKKYSHVKEVLLRCPSKLIWDQVLVPYGAWKEKVDVIFQPKYTVPLISKRPTVTICQGFPYYLYPEFYEYFELAHAKIFSPMYYKRARRVLAVSDDVQHLLNRYLGVPYEKMETMYLAANNMFSPRNEQKQLESVKEKYRLPDSFILSVTRGYQGKKITQVKNIDSIVKGFLNVRTEYPSLKLVLAGTDLHRYVATVFGANIADDSGLVYAGLVPQHDLPFLYSLAELFIFPSYIESFGIPLLEAMACGCPIITSTRGACPELVGDAALVVDPTDVEALSTAIKKILDEPELRRTLSERALGRAKKFGWGQSADQCIRIFDEIYRSSGYPRLGDQRALNGNP